MSDKHLTPIRYGSSLQTSTLYDIICSDYETHYLSRPCLKFEDTKGVIKSRKLKERQYNGQKKKDKRKNNDDQKFLSALRLNR